MIERDLALVGVGRWGRNLARNFSSLGVLHTICDADVTLAKQFQEEDVAFTDNFQSILNDRNICKVAIAAPAHLHYALAKEAILHGKDVFVEKPLCLDFEEAEKLCQLASEKERILMVGHVLQYHPAINVIRDCIAKGVLGELRYLSSHRFNFGPFRTENVVWDFAPHDLSILLSLAGSEPIDVQCFQSKNLSNVPDLATLHLTFSATLKGHVCVSWASPFKEQRLSLIGTKGIVVFDDTRPWNQKIELTPLQGFEKSDSRFIPVPEREPLREECVHFLACCCTRRSPRTDGREALRVMSVLDRSYSKI